MAEILCLAVILFACGAGSTWLWFCGHTDRCRIFCAVATVVVLVEAVGLIAAHSPETDYDFTSRTVGPMPHTGAYPVVWESSMGERKAEWRNLSDR